MKTSGRLVPLFFGCALAACDKNENPTNDASAMDVGETGDTPSSTGDGDESSGSEGAVEPEPIVYTVTIDGVAVPVERLSQFEIPVSYVHLSHSGTPLQVEITAVEAFTDFTLSPKSKNIAATAAGNTLSFTLDEPGYFILQIPNQERFFLLVDPPEVDAPQLGDPTVRNAMDIAGMDNTGVTDVTELVQTAIDEASGAAQNILYFPAGTYGTRSLSLRSDMTVYLAEGAVLRNITEQANLLGPAQGLTVIEGSSHGYIVMSGVTNAKLIGRGTIDGNGATLQASNRKMFLVKIENSSNSVIEGIIARDSAFWNTLIYRSENINISNYKVINNRLDSDWNETDGVNFDNTTASTLLNGFLYTGDDCMAAKSDDIQDEFPVAGLLDPTMGSYINVADITYEKVVCFSRSSGCKIGTKTFGETMSNVVYRNVDVVLADRGLVIDAVDTATITGTVFEDIRLEEITGRLVDFNMDPQSITWRTNPGTCTVTNTTVTNVSSESNVECRIQGNIHDWDEADQYYGNEYYVDGVTFTNFSIGGNVIASLEDPNASFVTNEYGTGITFVLPEAGG